MSSPGRGLLTVPRVTVALAALLLVVSGVVLAVRASSGGGETPEATGATPSASPDASDGATTGPTPSPTPSASAYPEVDVAGLTEPGTSLSFGEDATVAWTPRQRLVGALDLRVDAVERAPITVFEGWRLPDDARRSAAYFVRVRAENVGDTDLGGVRTPLYVVSETNTLIQHSTFASRFTPCPSTPLPERFRPGRAVEECLVFLVPDKGEATAVSFRPTQEFSPITWTGEEGTYRPGRGGAEGQEQRQRGGKRSS